MGVICRLLRLGSCKSLECGGRLVGDIPSSDDCIPGGDVGVSASLCTISFSFEAIRGKYLSHTQQYFT